MAFISVDLAGMNEVIETLSKLNSDVVAGVEKALNISAVAIERDAKKRVAVDTGRLRSSIRMQFFKNNATTAYIIYTDAKHAPWVEFGTGVFATKGAGRSTPWVYKYEGSGRKKGFYLTRGMRPKPFLFPAFEAERPKLISRMQKLLK